MAADPDRTGGRRHPRAAASRRTSTRPTSRDIHPPLTLQQSLVESDRCYFCYDAPCIEACPTRDRHPQLHPQDRHRQRQGRGARHPQAEHHGRRVRARLSRPRCCARARACATARSTSRSRSARCSAMPPTALFRSGTQLFKARAEHRQARRGRRRRPGRAVLCASARDARSRGHGVRSAAQAGRAERIRRRRLQGHRADRAARGGLSARGRQHRGEAGPARWAATSSLAQLRQDYDAVFVGVGLGAREQPRRGRGRIVRRARCDQVHRDAAPGRGPRRAAGRAAHRGDRRRHDGHRHRLSDQAAGRRGRDHGLSPRAGADGRQRQGAGLGPDQWRAHQALGAAGAAAVRRTAC